VGCLRQVEGVGMKRLHWTHFVFQRGDEQGSVYLGRKDKNVNLARIAVAKKAANMPDNSVMIACCYLGEMTVAEFNEGKDD
jgi:hypothetical protein